MNKKELIRIAERLRRLSKSDDLYNCYSYIGENTEEKHINFEEFKTIFQRLSKNDLIEVLDRAFSIFQDKTLSLSITSTNFLLEFMNFKNISIDLLEELSLGFIPTKMEPSIIQEDYQFLLTNYSTSFLIEHYKEIIDFAKIGVGQFTNLNNINDIIEKEGSEELKLYHSVAKVME